MNEIDRTRWPVIERERVCTDSVWCVLEHGHEGPHIARIRERYPQPDFGPERATKQRGR